MKKWLMLVLCLFLTGCGKTEFETMGDLHVVPVTEKRDVLLRLPPEAVASVFGGEAGSVYLCEGYTVTVLTLPGGDLSRTVREVSGFDRDRLELLRTEQGGMARYDFVWASAGEGGDALGRAAVVDDGQFHYVVSVVGDARLCGGNEEIDGIFASFALRQEA